MRSFNFADNNNSVEEIIRERKKRIARQQLIFIVLSAFVLVMLLYYVVQKVLYTEYDGYIQTDYKNYRAMDDIFVFDQFKDVGDIVVPGDTMYSYVYLNYVLSQSDLNAEPAVVVNNRNVELQAVVARQDINVLRTRIRELEKQITKEDQDIRLGLSDNSHKMDLQRQLAEARAQLENAITKASEYGKAKRQTGIALWRSGVNRNIASKYSGTNMVFDEIHRNKSVAINYGIARDTAVVTKIGSMPFSVVFKTEQILQLQQLNFEKTNFRVIAYVPTDKMKYINKHTVADVVVNDEVKFKAKVTLLGDRTEELPTELRDNLSHVYTVVVVVLVPLPNQIIPLWAAVDHVPVKVKVSNFNNGARKDGTDYNMIDGVNLTPMSQKELFKNK